MSHRRSWLVAALAAVAAAGPAAAQTGTAPAAAPPAAQPAAARKPIDRANFDTTCAACQNFFRYANGGWIKGNEIPAALSRWGGFDELAENNRATLRAILEEAAADRAAAPGSNAQRIGTYYRVCMDSARAERAGVAPVRPVLDRIAAIRSTADLRTALGPLEREAGLAPFGVGVGIDVKNATRRLVSLGAGGLGLPDRDYYVDTTARARQLRGAYVDHVTRLFELSGQPAAAARADAERVLALETRLARPQLTRVQRRDPNATYHKMSLAEAQRLAPGIAWQPFFAAQGAGRFDSVNVGQPEYLRTLDALLGSEPVDAWKAYLRAHALANAAPALSAAFVNADFAFNRNFSGAKELRPRWQRCASATDQALGEVLGQEYVRRAFPPESKARMQELVNNLQVVLREKIRGNAWMNDSTKRQALQKLDAFGKKIGYPDKWKDYAGLEVRDDTYYANRRRVTEWNRTDNWGRLTKPIDRTEWGMTPPTVNAYYSPLFNEIAFPAGILQPPFFWAQADDAVNYGAIGAVIGHEMTHGFDDQGRQFDAQGNLRDWWTAADAAKYKGEADKVAAQFSAYTVVDSATKVNGRLTLGENIADLGGIKIAYDAMQRAYAGKPKATIDGLTPEQRFFLAYAQVWRQVARDEYLRNMVVTDPHSPAVWRVNGPLSNLPEFHQAFGCKAGDTMVRPAEQRAQIW